MTKEKIKENLNIIELHLDKFYLAMDDHWSTEDYILDRDLSNKIKIYTNEYIAKYNEEPLVEKCKYHEDIVELKKRLEKDLTD